MTAATDPVRSAPSVVAATGLGVLLALVPGALTVYFGFRAGGFLAGATAGAVLLLLLLLAARVMLIGRPAEGVNRSVVLAVCGLLGLALWTLLSSRWSHAPARALVEFDRVLLYALAIAVFGSVGMNTQRLRWMVHGIALAALVVCVAGLITRLVPDVWPLVQTSPRLSYPVAYHNTFGLLAAVGIIICFGLTANEREPRLVRVVSAAAIPVLASALLLSLSRGGIATAALGVLVFAAVGHPRALLAGVLAAVPATAIALSSTYGAELLVSADPLSSAAQAQGEHVAAVVALCAVGAGLSRALLLYLDDVVVGLRPSAAARRQVLAAGAAALIAVATAGALAVDAPGKFEAFVSSGASDAPAPSRSSSDPDQATPGDNATALPRERLTTITDNGRIRYWRVAFEEFQRHVALGTGAGTYPNSWAIHRSPPPGPRARVETVRDAHSLYAEVLGELGIVGLVLLLTTLLTILVGVARRIAGVDRGLYATIFAAIIAWAVAAGFDWHWEMPVATLWVFAVGGAAIAGARGRTPATRFLGMLPRSIIAVACCALMALVPLRLVISDGRLQSARTAYLAGNCPEVSIFAQQSLDALDSRPEPRQFVAGCELTAGEATAAVSSLRAAVALDPDNWRVHYSLGIAKARAGQDPRPEIRRARQLNPLEPLVLQVARILKPTDTPRQWRSAARRSALAYLAPPL